MPDLNLKCFVRSVKRGEFTFAVHANIFTLKMYVYQAMNYCSYKLNVLHTYIAIRFSDYCIMQPSGCTCGHVLFNG